MSKRGICLVALLFALGSVIVVNAALEEILYLPDIRSGYPVIPTPSPTLTPNTPCLSLKTSGVCITEIEFAPFNGPLNEFIRLENLSSSESVDMENWRISSDTSNKFDLDFEFTLGTDDIVEIRTKSGTNDFDEIFMNREEEFWNDREDCAFVMNGEDPRQRIDGICYLEDDLLGMIFFAPPVTAP